jgi:NAD(P)-dependent dehydrogenase (short-subunit alcohol dehydrogenase family)
VRALITGAASGIGRAVAGQMVSDAARGGGVAKLMLVDVAADKLETAARELRADGGQIEVAVGDLADAGVPQRVVDAAARAFGGLDALISNAGIIQRGTLLELGVEDYDRCFAVNTRATWLLAKAAYRLLKQSRGCIVATASISAHHPTPPLGAYSASKIALQMLVRQLAVDFGPDGIRCNTVSPGSTHTAMTDARYSDPVQRAAAAQRNPLHMVGSPENQAAVICFLASPAAAYITGTDVLVDGGLSTMLMPASSFGDPWKKS